MTFSRKDATAAVLTVLTVLVFLAAHEGWGVPLVGDSYRWAAGVIALLGMATCSLGTASQGLTKGPVTTLLTALGIAALVLTALALWTGSPTALSLLVADIVVLWAVSTFRHTLHVPRKPVAA